MRTKVKKMSRSTRSTESSVPVIGVEDGWDDDSTKKLLEKMRTVLPKPDAVKYKTTLEKFKWETMKIDNFEPDQCKKQWGRLYKKLRKYRTLGDLIGESLELLDDPYKGVAKKHPDHPKRPLTPYFRFFLEQRRIYAETHKDLSNIEITTILSQKYRDISPELKQKYIEDWKREMVEYRKKIDNFKKNHPEYYDKPPPNPPRTPVQIYKELCSNKKKAKTDNLSSKSPYHDLPDSEKLPFILQAVEEFAIYQKEFLAYKQSHPGYCANEKKSVLSKEDWKIHDRSLGKPNRPPANGYNLFCSRLMVSDELKHYSSRERIMQCGKLWQELAEDEKKKYNEEYLKIRNEYRENLKKFLKSLSPAVRDAYLARKHSENTGNTSKSIKKEEVFSPSLKTSKKEESDMSDSSDEEELQMNDTSEESESSESSEEETDEPPLKKVKTPLKANTAVARQKKTRRRTVEKVKVETDWKQTSQTKSSHEKTSSSEPVKPLSAVFIYQQKNRKNFEKMFPHYPASEVTKFMIRTFCNLPVREKLKYKMMEHRLQQKRQAEILSKLESENSAMSELKAVTGEQIYHEQNRNLYLQKPDCNEENVDVVMRRAWSRMNKDRREKYIQIAHKINQQNIAERTAALTSENKAAPFNGQISDMSPKSIEAYHLYEPVKPPEEGFALFIRENKFKVQHFVASQRANQLSNLWNDKPEEIRKYYEDTASVMMEDYKKKHSKWLKSLPKSLQDKYKLDGCLLSKEEIEKRKKAKMRKSASERNLFSDWDFSSDEGGFGDTSSTSETDVSLSEFESGFNESASDHMSAEESSNSSSTDSQTETDDEDD